MIDYVYVIIKKLISVTYYQFWKTIFQFGFNIFRLFNPTIQFLQQINVKKSPSSIWCWDSNPQPSEHEFPLVTTGPQIYLFGRTQASQIGGHPYRYTSLYKVSIVWFPWNWIFVWAWRKFWRSQTSISPNWFLISLELNKISEAGFWSSGQSHIIALWSYITSLEPLQLLISWQ